MQNEIEEIIKHIVLANHDGELKAAAILMINKDGMPEYHFRVRSDDAFALNAGVDLLKTEMMIMMHKRMEKKGERK